MQIIQHLHDLLLWPIRFSVKVLEIRKAIVAHDVV
jgi:hypothetical protein